MAFTKKKTKAVLFPNEKLDAEVLKLLEACETETKKHEILRAFIIYGQKISEFNLMPIKIELKKDKVLAYEDSPEGHKLFIVRLYPNQEGMDKEVFKALDDGLNYRGRRLKLREYILNGFWFLFECNEQHLSPSENTFELKDFDQDDAGNVVSTADLDKTQNALGGLM